MSNRRVIRANKPAAPAGVIAIQAEKIDWSDVKVQGSESTVRRFDMLIYTGGALRLRGWEHPVVVDVAGLKGTDRKRPALKDHYARDPVGHFEAVSTTNNRVSGWGLISGTGENAKFVAESSRNGFPWQASIGADPSGGRRAIAFIAKGKSATANGRTFEGPVFIVRSSIFKEGSFVTLGADDDTSARVAAGKGSSMLTFEKWLEEKGFDIEAIDEAQKTSLRAWYDNEVTANTDADKGKKGGKKNARASAADDDQGGGDDPPAPTDDTDPPAGGNGGDALKAARTVQAEETKRVAAIRKVCGTKHSDIEAKAIDEGWDSDKTELAVMRAERPKHTGVFPAGAEASVQAQAIEAALCLSNGLPEKQVAEWYGEKPMNIAAGRDYRGYGIQQLCHEVIRAAGMHARAGRMDDDTIRTALGANERMVRASGGFSSASLSGTLGNVANKTLLNSFLATKIVSTEICGTRDLVDFKQATLYRMTMTGLFEKVGATGELKHAELSDETYSNQLDTYGRMLALTRQMIINDDLGAFLQIPQLLGRQAALALEEAVLTLILANTGTFFGSGNKNYISGAATNLSVGGLTSLEQKFIDQVDSAGKPIMVTPRFILVPTSLKVTAEQLMSSPLLLEAATAGSPTAASNPHSSKYAVKWSPYLNNSNFSGYSTTAWYLFADPAVIPAFEIGYLRGRRTPTIESGETDFNTLGMQWRGYWDFGVAQQDPRGAAKSKGAA